MTWADAFGVFGVLLILIAYALATLKKLPPEGAQALALNLIGALLILVSLAYDFNLSSVLMEGAWALVALVGLTRIAVRRMRTPSPEKDAEAD